jgi:hypothetical protein
MSVDDLTASGTVVAQRIVLMLSRCLARHVARTRSLRVPVAACVVSATIVLCACSPSQAPAPLAPVALQPAQTEALRRLNEAGTTAFDSRTWRYEFGANCLLRVHRTSNGRRQAPQDVPMSGHVVEVLAYGTGGFGVKAVPTSKGGSFDLFDTASDVEAQAFASRARVLTQGCG